jgi:hypothetical protein
MSQDDSRLTLSEKQKIADKFASKLQPHISPKEQKESDDWLETSKKESWEIVIEGCLTKKKRSQETRQQTLLHLIDTLNH